MSQKLGVDQVIEKRRPYLWEKLFAKFVRCSQTPKHITFIMDGNRRYAEENHVEKHQSYLQGLKQLSEVVLMCDLLDVKEVSVFFFSVENFKRSQDEIDLVMNLFFKTAEKISLKEITDDSWGFRFYGCLQLLPIKQQELMAKYTMKTQNSSIKKFINLCYPYSARFDIARSVDMLTLACANGILNIDDISPEIVEKSMLAYASLPPEVLVRTSGEIRFSDYMLWQTNHSLLHFVPKLWPQLTGLDIATSILSFQLKSNIEHLLHGFIRWTSSKPDKQIYIEKMEQFTKTSVTNYFNQVLDGKAYLKKLPLIESH